MKVFVIIDIENWQALFCFSVKAELPAHFFHFVSQYGAYCVAFCVRSCGHLMHLAI
ncbi:hypothetical protein HMPREF0971_01596 [Segatella oris F0302]|uniref:Uncharacterized protein n=1 Tax=Segatella oris F0302 TaxID=649760 RepID=D1QRJ0_9BACT|nr:hypothetical protein HMPREF0971_01596 [Segatella oris F0302]